MTISLPKSAREILANNITYFRLQRGWSQEDFAERLGSKATYISNLENAKRNVRIDYIEHIANTLNVSMEQLFTIRAIQNNHHVNRQ